MNEIVNALAPCNQFKSEKAKPQQIEVKVPNSLEAAHLADAESLPLKDANELKTQKI